MFKHRFKPGDRVQIDTYLQLQPHDVDTSAKGSLTPKAQKFRQYWKGKTGTVLEPNAVNNSQAVRMGIAYPVSDGKEVGVFFASELKKVNA